MKYLTIHWTGGAHKPNAVDLNSYHALVDVDGNRYDGDRTPEANRAPLGAHYARHCGGMNTDNIGIAMCGMHGARETPFDAGDYPLSPRQVDETILWCAELVISYNLKVDRNHVFTHAEVRPRFGRGVQKWDCLWLPGMEGPIHAYDVGDMLRTRIQNEVNRLRNVSSPLTRAPVASTKLQWPKWLLNLKGR